MPVSCRVIGADQRKRNQRDQQGARGMDDHVHVRPLNGRTLNGSCYRGTLRMNKIVTTHSPSTIARPKIAKIPLLKARSYRERRASHAESRDLCWSRGRPRLVDGAGPGQPFENPTGRRAAGVIVLQRDATDAGWNVAAAAVPGTGLPAAAPAQVRGAKSGAADALSARGPDSFRHGDACRIGSLRSCRAESAAWISSDAGRG